MTERRALLWLAALAAFGVAVLFINEAWTIRRTEANIQQDLARTIIKPVLHNKRQAMNDISRGVAPTLVLSIEGKLPKDALALVYVWGESAVRHQDRYAPLAAIEAEEGSYMTATVLSLDEQMRVVPPSPDEFTAIVRIRVHLYGRYRDLPDFVVLAPED